MPGRSFYEHYTLGTNLRLTGFQAAVLLAQLESLPAQIQLRTANARLLKHLLSDVPEIVWQQEPPQLTQSSHYLLPARLRNAGITRSDFCGSAHRRRNPLYAFLPPRAV